MCFTVCFSNAQETPTYAKIQYGESLTIDGLTIEFEKVISDSRCPEGVECVQAGEAKILVHILKGDALIETKEMTFYSSDVMLKMKPILFKNEAMVINALRLSPYPEVHHRIPEKMYCMDIAIN